MRNYVVVTTDLAEGPRWEIHLEGCKHSEKFRMPERWTVHAASPEAVITMELLTLDPTAGWTANDFKIAPCAKKVK